MAPKPRKLEIKIIMSTQKYVSDVKLLDHNQQIVFEYLSNFDNLSQYLNSELLEKFPGKFPELKSTTSNQTKIPAVSRLPV